MFICLSLLELELFCFTMIELVSARGPCDCSARRPLTTSCLNRSLLRRRRDWETSKTIHRNSNIESKTSLLKTLVYPDARRLNSHSIANPHHHALSEPTHSSSSNPKIETSPLGTPTIVTNRLSINHFPSPPSSPSPTLTSLSKYLASAKKLFSPK